MGEFGHGRSLDVGELGRRRVRTWASFEVAKMGEFRRGRV